MNTRNCRVSTTEIAELRAPKNGRSSLMIDNDSVSAVRYDFGVTPGEFTGIILEAGANASFDADRVIPQDTIYIRGTTATLQNITITESIKPAPDPLFNRLVRAFFP